MACLNIECMFPSVELEALSSPDYYVQLQPLGKMTPLLVKQSQHEKPCSCEEHLKKIDKQAFKVVRQCLELKWDSSNVPW